MHESTLHLLCKLGWLREDKLRILKNPSSDLVRGRDVFPGYHLSSCMPHGISPYQVRRHFAFILKHYNGCSRPGLPGQMPFRREALEMYSGRCNTCASHRPATLCGFTTSLLFFGHRFFEYPFAYFSTVKSSCQYFFPLSKLFLHQQAASAKTPRTEGRQFLFPSRLP